MKTIAPFALALLVSYVGWLVISTFMYNRNLLAFYGVSWKDVDYKLVANGSAPTYGDLANISNLVGVPPANGEGGTSDQWCPGYSSSRGHITVSFPIKPMVCCWANTNQRFVPVKTVEDTKHYLCGKWPELDEVTKR